MHNFIKVLLILALSATFCGCAKSVKITTLDKSYKTGTVTANVKIPQLKGLASEELQNAVNTEFLNTTGSLLGNFEEMAGETGEQSVFDMDTTEYYNKNGLLSIVTQYDYFARKSHKSSFRITKNLNTVACVEITLSDLFEDDSYIDVLNNLLTASVSAKPENYTDLWAKPKIMQNQNFYIDGENLVLCYPPYELSYYERGYVEIPIPIEEILTYLNPEYRKMLT